MNEQQARKEWTNELKLSTLLNKIKKSFAQAVNSLFKGNYR